MGILILIGIILLVVTYIDNQREGTDAMILLDWALFDINKEEHPTLFKSIIYIQTAIGIGMIVVGILF